MLKQRFEIRNDKHGVYYYDTLIEDRLSPYEVVGMLNQSSPKKEYKNENISFIESDE